jgi:hypothetical protein
MPPLDYLYQQTRFLQNAMSFCSHAIELLRAFDFANSRKIPRRQLILTSCPPPWPQFSKLKMKIAYPVRFFKTAWILVVLLSPHAWSWYPPGSHVGLPGCITLWYLFLFDLVEDTTCKAGERQSDLAFLARRMMPCSVGGKDGAAAGGGLTAAATVAFSQSSFGR